MWRSSNFFLILFFLFSIHSSLAQKDRVTVALKSVLQEISEQHNVKFNYIEEEIVTFRLVPPPKDWDLEAKIDYIKKETKLQFSITDKKYYTLFNDKKIDKPLCGYLLDAETGMPIENAAVNIKNTAYHTSSNNVGYFELPIVSSNNILIQHMSYAPLEIDVNDLYVVSCPKINLIPAPKELAEVITQQYLTTGITQKINGSLEIKPKKLGLLPGLIEPDILQTLQQIPGIYSTDETISNINVRGGTHDQNLFLWNGIRMFQTGHFFGLISAFNPSLPQDITVTKNGSSAFFGESVSSVVAISSHSKNIEASNTSISSNLISGEFYSKLKLSERASVEISGRRSYTDFFDSPTYRSYRDRVFQNTIVTNLNTNTINHFNSDENFYFFDWTVQYQQKIGKRHELTIDAIAIRNNLNIHQFDQTTYKNSALQQQNFGANIDWKTNWNSKNTSEINLSGSYYNLDATNASIQSNQILNQQNSVLDFGLQLKNTHQISETISFNNGYQLDEIGVTNYDNINLPAFTRKIKEVLTSHALIAEGMYVSFNRKTHLNTGLRLNYFEKFNAFVVEPRIQFNQVILPHFSIEILGEIKSQTLSQIIDLQQDFLGLEKRRWTLANNTTIPMEKSKQISLGFTFKNKSWLVTVDNFYKNINGITTSSQGFQNQFEFTKSVGNYHVWGTEILIQKNYNNLYAWLSYSLNNNKYTFESLSDNDFPNNFQLSHAITSAIIYDWNVFKMALGGKWHTGKPITSPINNTINTTDPAHPKINYNAPNTTNLPDYFQLNFSASKDWKLGSKVTLQASFSVLNLLNTKNVINRFYRINSSNNTIESVNTNSLERTPNLNLKVSF